MTASSRTRPFPYDARFRTSPDPNAPRSGNFGVMFIPNDSGMLVGKKQNIVDVPTTPQDFEYGSQPLYKERTFVFRPTMGMGERVQSALADHRYYWAMDMWVYGGLFGNGPLLHPLVPPATGSIRQFIDALGPGSVVVQYVLAGPNILRRSDDTSGGQVVDYSRAGQVATSAVRFRAQGTSPVDALYVAWDDGTLSQRGGRLVERHATPAGFNANFLTVVGPQLIAADAANSVVRVTTNDPLVAGSWGGPIYVGNPSVPIAGMTAAANRLIVFKADGGIYTLNADGSVNDEVPGARVPIDAANGRTAVPWLNSVYVRLGPSFWKIDMPDVVLNPIGPERQLDNGSEVARSVQAFAGWGAQTSFAAIYNSRTAASYLLTYGSWNVGQNDTFVFADQYDGAVAHWTGRQATALGVSNASGQGRLYIGFADGGYDWFKLVPNPLALDSGAEFVDSGSYIVLPLHHAMFEADTKAWTGFSVFGPQVTPTDFVTLSYRLMGTAGGPSTSPGVDYIDLPGALNFSGFRLDAPPNLNANAISLKVSLTNYDSTRTPVLEGVGIHERVIPRFRLDFSGTIDAREWVARRDGAAMRQSGRRIREVVQRYTASPNLAVIELPDETLDSVAIFAYTEHMVPWKQGGAQQWEIEFSASQFATLSVFGIIRRLRGTRIGDLRGFSIDELRVM